MGELKSIFIPTFSALRPQYVSASRRSNKYPCLPRETNLQQHLNTDTHTYTNTHLGWGWVSINILQGWENCSFSSPSLDPGEQLLISIKSRLPHSAASTCENHVQNYKAADFRHPKPIWRSSALKLCCCRASPLIKNDISGLMSVHR